MSVATHQVPFPVMPNAVLRSSLSCVRILSRRMMRCVSAPCAWMSLVVVALLVAGDAAATRVQYDVLFADTEGDLFFGTFFVEDADLAAQLSMIDLYDFEATVQGTLYSNTYYLAQNPMTAIADYEPGGELVTVEPPYVHSEGQPTTVNLRLLRDGTWVRDVCGPLPECNPDYGSGTYTLVQIPEPSTGALLALGIIFHGLFRCGSWVRGRRGR